MKKRYGVGCMIMLSATLSFAGCNNKDVITEEQVQEEIAQEETQEMAQQEQQNQAAQGVTYSNLIDQATQDEVKAQMLSAGIDESAVDAFFTWVNDYNNNVESAAAFGDGYQVSINSTVDYNDVTLIEEYHEDGSFAMDMNCRLTAYLLFKQYIGVEKTFEDYDPYLMFDIEEMELQERYQELLAEKDKFIAYYNPVEVAADSTLEQQIQAIQEAWKERGITIADNDSVSIITMYLHDNYENKRFVGHIGVAINTEEGILFIEKYGWNMPFQATKFESESDMVDYLLSRPDLVGDGTEEPTIVMKNDTVISK